MYVVPSPRFGVWKNISISNLAPSSITLSDGYKDSIVGDTAPLPPPPLNSPLRYFSVISFKIGTFSFSLNSRLNSVESIPPEPRLPSLYASIISFNVSVSKLVISLKSRSPTSSLTIFFILTCIVSICLISASISSGVATPLCIFSPISLKAPSTFSES